MGEKMDSERVLYIVQEFQKCGISITQKQAEQFEKFYEMLIEKNKVMNLTGITEFEEVVRKHFIDSVMNVKLSGESVRVLDVGTGAGFPGIPLKILCPDLNITLLDSLNKRILFLNEVVEVLGLQNVELVHGRAEDFGHLPAYREQFDNVCSRAVANLSSLCEYCIPFLKIGGTFISYKSSAQEELEAARYAVRQLGGDEKHIDVNNFLLPESDEKRSLIYISKVKATPKRFPRKAGMPTKEPLKEK